MPRPKGLPKTGGRRRKVETPRIETVYRPIAWFRPYERNPRKNDKAVERIRASIREFGFSVPILARSTGEVIDGHLRLKGAVAEKLAELPTILCDGWTEAQVKAFRLMVNRSVAWADWDLDALALEFADIKGLDFDLSMTGFDTREIDALMLKPNAAEDDVPPVPDAPVTRTGDLWLLGPHRLLCGDSTDAEDVGRVLAGAEPALVVTDPPYGVSLDMEWRDRAGANGLAAAQPSYMRTRDGKPGHREVNVSHDTRADWSPALELVPSLQIAYVWHASVYTREVLNGLERIGFLYPQQIIWDKGVAMLTRTHYWYGHEPCWYVRKKRAHWHGKPGESTVWRAPSPKFLMGGSKEEKMEHPTQKPVELMRRPLINHLEEGALVYEPFGGSGTTLAAAEVTGRVCISLELEPRYCDVIVTRWENLTGKKATLEGHAGLTFEQVKFGRRLAEQDAIKEHIEELTEARA